jgi:hypothetical protein
MSSSLMRRESFCFTGANKKGSKGNRRLSEE